MNLLLCSLLVLLLGAVLALLLRPQPRASLAGAATAICLAGALQVIASVRVLAGGDPGAMQAFHWQLPLGTARLALDGLSAWFLLTIAVLAICVAIYSPGYLGDPKLGRRAGNFGALLCLLLGSLVLVVSAADAVLFLIAWEGMTLTAFLLVTFEHERAEVQHGAWMYLIATHIGTALCVVPLLALLGAWSGGTAFASFSTPLGGAGRATLIGLFLLALMGFGTKAGFLPMHVWLPAAHPVAPTPVSALLSGVVVKTGIYALLRFLSWMPPLPVVCGGILLGVGVVSGVMGVLYALGQHNLKRLLAYHTIENIGIIAIGMAVGMLGQTAGMPRIAVLGYAGALLHVTNHALFKGLLFLSAGAVLHGTGTVEIERLGGLLRKAPANALLFLVGAVAICGLPPLNGFVGEWVIYQGLFGAALGSSGGMAGLSALGIPALALMGGLALACFAKVMGVVFLGVPRDTSLTTHATPVGMNGAMALLAACCALIGLLPELWVPLCLRAVAPLCRLSETELAHALSPAIDSSMHISLLALVLLGLTASLFVLRRMLSARAAASDSAVGTWGCGFPAPTARMQYTATAFAAPLMGAFRTLLWQERHLDGPAGTFPRASRVSTHLADMAENDVFRPVFQRIDWVLAGLRTLSWKGAGTTHRTQAARPLRAALDSTLAALRRGTIQVYLLFIVLTLVFLFLIEGFTVQHTRESTPATPPSAETLP